MLAVKNPEYIDLTPYGPGKLVQHIMDDYSMYRLVRNTEHFPFLVNILDRFVKYTDDQMDELRNLWALVTADK